MSRLQALRVLRALAECSTLVSELQAYRSDLILDLGLPEDTKLLDFRLLAEALREGPQRDIWVWTKSRSDDDPEGLAWFSDEKTGRTYGAKFMAQSFEEALNEGHQAEEEKVAKFFTCKDKVWSSRKKVEHHDHNDFDGLFALGRSEFWDNIHYSLMKVGTVAPERLYRNKPLGSKHSSPKHSSPQHSPSDSARSPRPPLDDEKALVARLLDKLQNAGIPTENLSIDTSYEKALVVIGDTKKYKEEMKELGGKYSRNLSKIGDGDGKGWLFSRKRLSAK